MVGEMKDKSNPIFSRGITSHRFTPFRGILIRKNSQEEQLLRQIRRDLLFSKLRSLLPPLPSSEGPMVYDLPREEMPTGDSDEESAETPVDHLQSSSDKVESKDESGEICFEESSDQEEGREGEASTKPFIPSLNVRRMDGSLLISTVVLKDVALTSSLFRILEEEKLDILFENQYRTETRVAHTIQVRIAPDYDVDALETKLGIWAGKDT